MVQERKVECWGHLPSRGTLRPRRRIEGEEKVPRTTVTVGRRRRRVVARVVLGTQEFVTGFILSSRMRVPRLVAGGRVV